MGTCLTVPVCPSEHFMCPARRVVGAHTLNGLTMEFFKYVATCRPIWRWWTETWDWTFVVQLFIRSRHRPGQFNCKGSTKKRATKNSKTRTWRMWAWGRRSFSLYIFTVEIENVATCPMVVWFGLANEEWPWDAMQQPRRWWFEWKMKSGSWEMGDLWQSLNSGAKRRVA